MSKTDLNLDNFFACYAESMLAKEAINRQRRLEKDYFADRYSDVIREAKSVEELFEILGALPYLPHVSFVKYPDEDEGCIYAEDVDEILDNAYTDCLAEEVNEAFNLDIGVLTLPNPNLGLTEYEVRNILLRAFNSIILEGTGRDFEFVDNDLADAAETAFVDEALPAVVSGLTVISQSINLYQTKLVIRLRTTVQDVREHLGDTA